MEEEKDPVVLLAASVKQLAKEVAGVRAEGKRHNVILYRLLALIGGIAAVATAGAVTALVLLAGAIGDIRDQTLASCGAHRDWVELPAAAASAAAARTPGATPTINPFLEQLVASERKAYEEGGCVEETGPLPTPAPPSGGG